MSHIQNFPKRKKLYEKGLSDGEIASKVGVTKETIYSWRKRRGLVPNKKRGGQVLNISLKPTRELGYFCGLVMGDGCTRKNGSNYLIEIESTKEDIINIFYKSAKRLGMNPFKTGKEKTRTFPNGESRTDMMYRATACSRVFYDAFSPYDNGSFDWEFPEFLSTKESLWGFVGGLADAEGYLATGKKGIGILVNCRRGLKQVKEILEKELRLVFGSLTFFEDRKGRFHLEIYGHNLGVFLEKAELRLKKNHFEKNIHSPTASNRVSGGDLARMYWREEKSIGEIAEELNRHPVQIRRWMDKCDIPRRDLSQATKLAWEKGRRS